MPVLRIAPLVFILLVAVADASPAAAKTCKSWGFVGQAIAATKPQALVLARLNWAVKVTNYWGVAWRNYNIASHKSEYCEAGGAAGLRQRCMAEAIPCKP